MESPHHVSSVAKVGFFISQHIQAFRSAFQQFTLSPFSTIVTFLVIGIALALPMGLYVLLQNVQMVGNSLHDSAQISLYLDGNISEKNIADLMKTLRVDKDISTVNYISPDQGLKEFQQQLGLGDVLNELKSNPLPGVIIIEPSNQLSAAFQLSQLVSRLKQLPFVNYAQLDMVWLQRLNAILLLCHRFLYALIFLFSLGVLLIIGNTIRLITQNYREEILITKLLGGSNNFIRRPFLYTGFLYGLFGGMMAWLFVDFTVWWLEPAIQRLVGLYSMAFMVKGLTLRSTFILLIGGAILGYIGSWLAVAKHMNEMEPR